MKTVWRAEGDHYTFANDHVSGKYLTVGHYQGMRSLVHRASGVEIAAGETLPGLVCPYRVFANGCRYEDVRERRADVKIAGDKLAIAYPADDRNPFDLVSLLSWNGPQLDIDYQLEMRADMRGFELGIASYLAAGFRGFVYRQSNNHGEDAPRFVPVDVNPMTDVYALFPRNEAAMATIFDGRWDLPPYPVRYCVPAYFASPLAYRHHAPSLITAVGMGDPAECYAVCMPVNNPPENPDPANGYQAIYFYCFGRDLRRGETATMRVRWMVGQAISEPAMLAAWKEFVVSNPLEQ